MYYIYYYWICIYSHEFGRKVNIRNIVSYVGKPTDYKYLNIIRHFILELIIENNFRLSGAKARVMWVEEFEN